jgi:aminoglycoside N3'-acetyltransferase
LVETDVYSVEKFKEKSKPLMNEIAIKRVSVSETNIDLYDAEECVNYSVNFLQLLPKYWISL